MPLPGTPRRADVKLQYAKVHIEELREYPNRTLNDEWERAHQESVFYHLAGAVEALLQEINDGYSIDLPIERIRWDSFSNSLKSKNATSPAFDHLKKLRDADNSWVAHLDKWRNHGAHRRGAGKFIALQGAGTSVAAADNRFKDPGTGREQTLYPGLGCQEVLDRLAQEVETLITQCRAIDPRLAQEELAR